MMTSLQSTVSASTALPPAADSAPLLAVEWQDFLPLLQPMGRQAPLLSPPIEDTADTDVPPADGSALVPLLLNLLAAATPPAVAAASADAQSTITLPSSASTSASAPTTATATLTSLPPTATPLAATDERLTLLAGEVPVPAAMDALSTKPENLPPRLAATPPLTPAMDLPPGNPRWDTQLGERVLWSVHRGLDKAQIQLHPQELGRVNVSLEVEHDQARVSFSVSQVQAAVMIEQALPRLRELFAHEGLNLAQVQVSTQTAQDGTRQQATPPPAPFAGAAGVAAEDDTAAEPVRVQRRQGLLDDYA